LEKVNALIRLVGQDIVCRHCCSTSVIISSDLKVLVFDMVHAVSHLALELQMGSQFVQDFVISWGFNTVEFINGLHDAFKLVIVG